jgi:hypothetical protein
MTAALLRHVLPSLFIERYRPVRSHRHEKALGGYLFDPNAARFFIRMATVEPVPAEVLWSVLAPAAPAAPFRIVSGLREQHALGHVICQVPYAAGEEIEFPLPRQLTCRARLRIATLQQMLEDIRQAGLLASGSEVAALIERRIEELRV